MFLDLEVNAPVDRILGLSLMTSRSIGMRLKYLFIDKRQKDHGSSHENYSLHFSVTYPDILSYQPIFLHFQK